MEKSEALLILGISHEEEAESAYEEKVFEWKNFFVNRFPVPKLFHAKIIQLDKLETAYRSLEGQSYTTVNEPVKPYLFEKDFKLAFHEYSNKRSQLKMQLFAATNAEIIKRIVLELILLTKAYASVWTDSKLDTTGVIVSIEPDPMDVLKAIEEAKLLGVHNISEIDRLPEDHLVLKEAKRLSLWSKMTKE